MKKFLTLICMIACIFGLTACQSEEKLSEYEQWKLDYAKQSATQNIIPLFTSYMDDEMAVSLDIYTLDEITYIMGSENQINITGYVTKNGIESFHSAKDSTGKILEIIDTTAEIDDDTIIVEATVRGEKKDAIAEVIFSNDMFMDIESVSLNPVSGMGELMTKAALNTAIGMGTVFVVLILISLIISLLGLIPALQAKMAGKKEPARTGADNAAAQITAQEEQADEMDETDDLELAAVIAAAVAASEGAASTDGFVVRSIRRRA